MSYWWGPSRGLLDDPIPLTFRDFCQTISQKDSKIPDDILRKASDVFNKLNGLKQVEKNHFNDVWDHIETRHHHNKQDNHIKKIYEKVDEAALKNLELIVEIIEHYKNKHGS